MSFSYSIMKTKIKNTYRYYTKQKYILLFKKNSKDGSIRRSSDGWDQRRSTKNFNGEYIEIKIRKIKRKTIVRTSIEQFYNRINDINYIYKKRAKVGKPNRKVQRKTQSKGKKNTLGRVVLQYNHGIHPVMNMYGYVAPHCISGLHIRAISN